MSEPLGFFALVLHAHVPWVLRHRRGPLGTARLCEAVACSHAPLLAALERLTAQGARPRVTVAVSPVLAEQWGAPEFEREVLAHLEAKARSVASGEASALAPFWEAWCAEASASFQLGGDLLARLRALESTGSVETIPSAATHGYLPLLLRDESVELQVSLAVSSHRRRFGKPPRGFWLPECAYRPRYAWTPPTADGRGREPRLRRGLEEVLSANGTSYFFAEAHLLGAGEPLSVYRDFFPALARLRGREERFPAPPRTRSPYRAYLVASRGGAGTTAVFARDPRTTLQVWSRDHGYPGDAAYLETRRRTYPGAKPPAERPYEPGAARARAEEHGRHFVWLVAETLRRVRAEAGEAGVLVAPFEAGLFGRAWFEGPLFLEHALAGLREAGVVPVTASEALELRPPAESVPLAEGSWGEGGDHRVWLNAETRWIWDRLYDAEDELALLLAGSGAGANPSETPDRLRRLAARELLVLQASDWPFLVTTDAAREDAERRFAIHYADFKRIADLARRAAEGDPLRPEEAAYAGGIEARDDLFPVLDLGPSRRPSA